MKYSWLKKTGMVALLFCFQLNTPYAQNILQKNISIQAANQKLSNVLEIISNKGDFNFSYNSNSIKRDSLVSLHFTNKPIDVILHYLFSMDYEFIESGNYIIIRRKAIAITAKPIASTVEEKVFYITGYIYDAANGEKLNAVSVYEPRQLSSDFTNEQGYFKIKIKNNTKKTSITISKVFYEDTTIVISQKVNQKIYVTLQPDSFNASNIIVTPKTITLPDTLTIKLSNGNLVNYSKIADSIKVQKSWLGNLLLSTRQKAQSINLRNFFATRNFQLSFVPGLSTQGKLSSQVSNNFSLNILGGYTGGVRKMEIAGLFNLNKKNVTGFQAAGLINIVGGAVHGFQTAGIQNLVLDSVRGWQIAGISNYVKSKIHGVQLAGIYNHNSQSLKGLQVGGIANFTKTQVRGVQIAGILNYAKKINGLQIGLINIADTMNGFAIGLINYSKNGYHKLSISTDEVNDIKLGYKSGNRKCYSIIEAGVGLRNSEKQFSIGYGIGRENKLSNQLVLNTELTSNTVYLGSWDFYNIQNKLALLLQWKAGKNVGVYLGPSLSIFTSNQTTAINGYAYNLPKTGFSNFSISSRTKGWVGFTAGLHLF